MKKALKLIQGSFNLEKQLFTQFIPCLLYSIGAVVCPLLDQMCLIYALFFLLSLRPLDVEFMRRLSKVVNIVPVIAKADTLTLEERDFFKKKVASCFSCLPLKVHV